MTALAANAPDIRGAVRGRTRSFVIKNSQAMYVNGFCGLDTNGLLVPWSDTAGLKFLGVFCGFDRAGVTAGDTSASPPVRGIVDVSGQFLNNVDVAGVTARTDLDDVLVYCADDNPATLSTTATVNVGAIGRLVDFRTVSDMDIQLLTPMEYQIQSGRIVVVSFHLPLATVANGDMVTGYVPGFAGRILSLQTVNSVVVTTGAKAASLNAEIDGTNVTGGVVALTSANQTPVGARVAGSAITGANKFGPTSAIDIEASSVTAFAEGAVTLYLTMVAD